MMIRQGDVLVERVRAIPAAATAVPRERGRIILAEGEVTGHAHAIAEPDAVLLTTVDNERFLRLVGAATIVHEEHAPITLPPGEYRVVRQREYAPEAIRQVAD